MSDSTPPADPPDPALDPPLPTAPTGGPPARLSLATAGPGPADAPDDASDRPVLGGLAPDQAPTTPDSPDPLSEPAAYVPDAQLVGRWERHGSVSGGPAGAPGQPPGAGGAIGWMRAYELRADGSFQMSAYPPMSLSGRWRRVGSTGARAELVHDRLQAPDGTPRVVAVRGLALDGQPVSFLEIEGERYPRVTPATP